MRRADDDARHLHLTLERLCSLFRSQLREEAVRHGLQLVQLEALIYFSVANRYSDTAGALADYLGVTKGTASQTVIALVKRGHIEKVTDAADGRIQHCALTAAGFEIVEASHPGPIASALRPNSAARQKPRRPSCDPYNRGTASERLANAIRAPSFSAAQVRCTAA